MRFIAHRGTEGTEGGCNAGPELNRMDRIVWIDGRIRFFETEPRRSRDRLPRGSPKGEQRKSIYRMFRTMRCGWLHSEARRGGNTKLKAES